MRLLALGCLVSLSCLNCGMASAHDPLTEFQWKHRLILHDLNAAEARAFKQAVHQNEDALDERDLRLIALSAEVESKLSLKLEVAAIEQLQKKFRNQEPSPKLYLVGKDGGLKMTRLTIELAPIFNRIDSMPMRQAEIQSRE